MRLFCQVNTKAMRSARSILQQPGLSLPKAAILAGFPDWPCSVLAGIFGVHPSTMALNRLPAVILITPLCLAGASLGTDPPYSRDVGRLVLAAAALMAAAVFFLALFFINRKANGPDGLADVPIDEEVDILERRHARSVAVYRTATRWHRDFSLTVRVPATSTKPAGYYELQPLEGLPPVPVRMRVVLCTAALVAWGVVEGVLFADDTFFVTINITDPVGDVLEGNVRQRHGLRPCLGRGAGAGTSLTALGCAPLDLPPRTRCRCSTWSARQDGCCSFSLLCQALGS